MQISIDGRQSAGQFNRFWRATGFSPGQLLLLPHMRAALAMVGGTPNRGIEYLRPHYLFELVRAQRSGTKITYDWSLLDQAVDTMVEFGFKPFFELMGNPSEVFTGFASQDDILVWRDFVSAAVTRFRERYGKDEVAQWYFETWNEPDLPWWSHGERGFLNYYDACVAGIDAVDPTLKIGGPGTALHMSPLFKAFVAHCDTGVSAVTGDAPPRIDFISIHEKGGHHHPEDITPDSLGMTTRELAVANHIRTHHPRLAHVPLVNNECDPQVGWWDIHTWNATSYVAAIMAKIVDQHQRVLIEEANVPYTMLASDNAFIGTWGQRTQLAIFAERKFDKGQTEFKTDADELDKLGKREEAFAYVKKPSLVVAELLALLGDERIPVTATPALAPDTDGLGVIATRHADGRIATLVYNSDDRVRRSGERQVKLDLALGEGAYDYAVYAIGEDDAFGVWDAERAPEVNSGRSNALNDTQLAAMRAVGEPELAQHGTATGTLSLDLTLILPSVLLIVAEPAGKAAPATPTALAPLKTLAPTGTREVTLRWADSGTFTSYLVETASEVDGPFTVVTERPILANATIVSTAGGARFARITARNLAGAASVPLVVSLA